MNYDNDEAGSWNMPQPDTDSTWERHTVDVGREPETPPETSRGAIWAWIAIGALVGLYCAWRWIP